MNILNFTVDQGETFIKNISLVDSSNNNALQYALSANGQVRQFANSANIVATMNCTLFSSNNTIQDTLTITIPASQTQNLIYKTYSYDVRVTWANETKYILGGKLTINPTVTR